MLPVTEFASSRLFHAYSCGAEGDPDPLPDPAGGKQLLREGTVEGVEPGLPVSVVRERPRLVVQQHADAAVMGVAGQRLPPPVVPGAQLVLVQLQAPGQFIHTHHAPLSLLLPGNGLIGYLVTDRAKDAGECVRNTRKCSFLWF